MIRRSSAIAKVGIALSVVGLAWVGACKIRKPSSNLEVSRGIQAFSGACKTKGQWSSAAVTQMQALRNALNQVRDVPACKKLYSASLRFESAAGAFSVAPRDKLKAERFFAIPVEIAALRMLHSFSLSDRDPSLSMLSDRVFEQKMLEVESAKDDGAPTDVSVDDSNALSVSRTNSNLFQRTRQSGNVALDALVEYIGALKDSPDCVLGMQDTGVALINDTLKLLGAVSSGNQGAAARVGSFMQVIAQSFRERRFVQAIRKQSEEEFSSSVACMLETTTYSYCSAADAQYLITHAGDSFGQALGPNPSDDNPFYGYYILTRHIPQLDDWLSQMMAGTVPNRKSQASEARAIMSVPSILVEVRDVMRGQFAEGAANVLAAPDLKGRQDLIVKLIMKLAGLLKAGPKTILETAGLRVPSMLAQIGGKNFYTQKIQSTGYLPFLLIGVGQEKVPKALRPGISQLKKVTFDGWAADFDNFRPKLDDGSDFSPNFQEPEKLLGVIESNMESLLEDGTTVGMEFFWSNFSADFDAQASQLFLSPNATTYQSLRAVRIYLDSLMSRINVSRDQVGVYLVPLIIDTINRIDKVFQAADALQQGGGASVGFARTVFEQFEMVAFANTLLRSRVGRFVKYDMIQRTRSSNLGMLPHEKEILGMGDELALSQLLGEGRNPNTLQTDLAQAQILNKTSLQAIGLAFGDPLRALIAKMRRIATGNDTSLAGIRADSIARSRQDVANQAASNGGGWSLNGLFAPIDFFNTRAFLRRSAHPDLYPMPYFWQGGSTARGASEDQFHSAQTVWAYLCVLTLALPNSIIYNSDCQGAVLVGNRPISDDPSWKDLSIFYDKYAQSKVNDGSLGDPICAFYNGVRRNAIDFMQSDELTDPEMIAKLTGPKPNVIGKRAFAELSGFSPKEYASSSIFAKRQAKSAPNLTLCQKSGGIQASVCRDYRTVTGIDNVATAGQVAVSCLDMQGNLLYCCSGDVGGGSVPQDPVAPCYTDPQDVSSFVPAPPAN